MSLLKLCRIPYLTKGNVCLSTTSRNSCAVKPARLESKCQVFQSDKDLTIGYVRRHSTNHGIPNIANKQKERRQSGRKILAYVSGFAGACLLTAFSAREYMQRTSLMAKAKELVPVTNPLYGEEKVLFHYRGYIMPNFYMEIVDKIDAFKVREDDIFIMSFPKAGTTWLQEIVYLIESGADFEGAKVSLMDRSPYFEYIYPGIEKIEEMPSPRHLKTHVPFSLLPDDYYAKKPKTIYIARNVKDTVVSLYNFLLKFLEPIVPYQMSFDEYCQLFVDDEVIHGPWWKHVTEAWQRRNDENVLFITYEDMNEDLPGSIKKIAKFLGRTLSPKDVEAIASHCSFDAMRTNNSVNFTWFKDRGMAAKDFQFMRKGQVGDWKNHLSKEMTVELDEMVANKVEPTGLKLRDTLGKR